MLIHFLLSRTPTFLGFSFIGLRYDDGVVIAADSCICYGSSPMFLGEQRVHEINDKTILAFSGSFADFQHVMQKIETEKIDAENYRDAIQMTPRGLHSWLTRLQYYQRSKMEPLWNSWAIGGIEPDGKPFLGYVDKLGTAFENQVIASGFGLHVAVAFLRSSIMGRDSLTKEQAIDLVKESLSSVVCLDRTAYSKYHIAVIDKNGPNIEGPLKVEQKWPFLPMAV